MSLQSILLLAVLIASASAELDAKINVYCDEALMKEVMSVVDDAPTKIRDATIQCMETNSPKEELKKIISIQCDGKTVSVPRKYVLGLNDPMQFADCASTALVSLEVSSS
ncbi:uncharacterized protein NPIL_416521 [Nephila pilipes]|uniref:Spider venom protein n=1 Tax=Nephila pilipes TaxID=299642 RepID=A0A8X6U656_NEPPI|nr:uncharacterized protein NPIL_416521 [Nephila pilipes]